MRRTKSLTVFVIKIHTWNLKNALGTVGVGDVQGICGIIEDDGAVGGGKVHQLLQLFPGGGSACGVVWGAEKYQVCRPDLHPAIADCQGHRSICMLSEEASHGQSKMPPALGDDKGH